MFGGFDQRVEKSPALGFECDDSALTRPALALNQISKGVDLFPQRFGSDREREDRETRRCRNHPLGWLDDEEDRLVFANGV